MEDRWICPNCLSDEVYGLGNCILTFNRDRDVVDDYDYDIVEYRCNNCRELIKDFRPHRWNEYKNSYILNVEEFQVNKYLTLKLINNKTILYVNGKQFNQCKYLLLINPHEDERQEEIESIDEASEVLNNVLENNEIELIEFKITPIEEFRAHCSNIQAWAENCYDTRILHRNLAFPLLKKLTELGDSQATKVFKDEIAKRFISGYSNIQSFLVLNGYMNYLNKEEIQSVLSQTNLSKIDLNKQTSLTNFIKKHLILQRSKTGIKKFD